MSASSQVFTGSDKHPAEMTNQELAQAIDNYVRCTVLEFSTEDLLNSAVQRLRGAAQRPSQPQIAALARDLVGAGESEYEPRKDLLPLTFSYKNHRGEVATRVVTPIFVRYGSTEWHPELQWLLRAFDHEKQAEREFAMKDIGGIAYGAWQPIETAPKRIGRHLRMFGNGDSIHECEFIGSWRDYSGVGGWVEAYSERRVEPTHWMEIGPAPLVSSTHLAPPDLEGWDKVGDGTPLNAWLETKLYGEEGHSESFCRLMSIGDEPEWIARDGRTTVTHHSYAAPTHWRWPKDCTCGGEPGQASNEHDISCPVAISSTHETGGA